MTTMLEEYFLQLESALGRKMEQKATARRRFIYEIARIGCRMFSSDWKSAWTTVFVPFEILNAMGVAGNFIEFVGAMLSGAGTAGRYLEKAEAAGLSADGCSYHRTIIGAAMEGFLPEPDLLIGSSFPCDGGLKALCHVGQIYNKEVFIINTPFDNSPEAINYLVSQYRDMIDFITRQTGRTLDYDLLHSSIRNNNTAHAYFREVMDLCKNIPSPASSDDLKNFIIYVLLGGSDSIVEVGRAFRDELRHRVDNNVPGLPGERIRLLWIQNRLQFPNNLIKLLEERFNANVVIDELNHLYWEPLDESEDPLVALARRQVSHPLVGPAGRRLDVLVQLARDYQVHGAINPAHWGCRQSSGIRLMFNDALQTIGVPVLHLDVDCVDERNFSEGQVITRLEAFMEML
jgi:benzoyl-CoA reductase/2-hydroxyglutaryl-CoA dehydratase subunit BcrC/BadD/HgdB